MFAAVFAHQEAWRLYAFGKVQPALQCHVEDILQDFYIKCFLNWQQIPPEKTTHYLYSMLQNEIRAFFRKRKPTAEIRPHLIDRSHQTDLADASFLELVQATLDPLKQVLRESDFEIIWHRAYGYSTAEIAELMSISPGAVDSRIHRIRKKLRLLF